jgi:hypothetical protein
VDYVGVDVMRHLQNFAQRHVIELFKCFRRRCAHGKGVWVDSLVNYVYKRSINLVENGFLLE